MTEFLAADENLAALADLCGQRIDPVHEQHRPKMVVLDMDSSVSPTHITFERWPEMSGEARKPRKSAANAISSGHSWNFAASIPYDV